MPPCSTRSIYVIMKIITDICHVFPQTKFIQKTCHYLCQCQEAQVQDAETPTMKTLLTGDTAPRPPSSTTTLRNETNKTDCALVKINLGLTLMNIKIRTGHPSGGPPGHRFYAVGCFNKFIKYSQPPFTAIIDINSRLLFAGLRIYAPYLHQYARNIYHIHKILTVNKSIIFYALKNKYTGCLIYVCLSILMSARWAVMIMLGTEYVGDRCGTECQEQSHTVNSIGDANRVPRTAGRIVTKFARTDLNPPRQILCTADNHLYSAQWAIGCYPLLPGGATKTSFLTPHPLGSAGWVTCSHGEIYSNKPP